MIHLKNKTIGNIVTENVNTAKIFHKYQIDFGFNGDIILKKVCKEKNLNLNEVISDLKAVKQNNYYLKDYNSWNLNLLIRFLIDVHHNHKQDDILLLKTLATQINTNYSSLININDLVYNVISLADDVLVKMNYEETIIYPHIKKLVAINTKPKSILKIQPILTKNIATIENQRIIISEKLKKIILQTNYFKMPKNACKTFQLFYKKLNKFQIYLQEHNHIEKNILLPKALELEKYITCKI